MFQIPKVYKKKQTNFGGLGKAKDEKIRIRKICFACWWWFVKYKIKKKANQIKRKKGSLIQWFWIEKIGKKFSNFSKSNSKKLNYMKPIEVRAI